MGLTVVWEAIGGRVGELRVGGVVVLDPRGTTLTHRTTLAHELGHWFLGHDWRGRHDHARDEREADLYAARLLIRPGDYARAERMYGHHPGAIARELGVPTRFVTLWREAADCPRCVGCVLRLTA
jgi:hypothetical protein